MPPIPPFRGTRFPTIEHNSPKLASFIQELVHLPTQKLHLPTQKLHLPTQKLHLPTQKLHLPTQKLHLPTQKLHLPTLYLHERWKMATVPQGEMAGQNIPVPWSIWAMC